MGFRYRLASTLHDAYSDLGPSHLLIIRHASSASVGCFGSVIQGREEMLRTRRRKPCVAERCDFTPGDVVTALDHTVDASGVLRIRIDTGCVATGTALGTVKLEPENAAAQALLPKRPKPQPSATTGGATARALLQPPNSPVVRSSQSRSSI